MPLQYETISSLGHELLPAWTDLYELSFPQNERVLFSYIINAIRAREDGKPTGEEIVAVLDEKRSLAGILFYEVNRAFHTAGLYYFAVAPHLRSQGLGGQMYREVLKRCRSQGCRLLVFDVEIPELCATSDERELARRRIGFYYRHGTQLLIGARSILQVHPQRGVIPLYIMAHALEPVTVDEVCAAARALLGKEIAMDGPLSLGQSMPGFAS